MNPKVSITKTFEFESCHKLVDYVGKCANLHGHSYKLEVTITDSIDFNSSMVMDFKKLKKIVGYSVIEVLDHKNLNTVLPNLRKTTAESIIIWIAYQLRTKGKIPVTFLRLFETSTSYVTYFVGENKSLIEDYKFILKESKDPSQTEMF